MVLLLFMNKIVPHHDKPQVMIITAQSDYKIFSSPEIFSSIEIFCCLSVEGPEPIFVGYSHRCELSEGHCKTF